jgi:hypothetical protein
MEKEPCRAVKNMAQLDDVVGFGNDIGESVIRVVGHDGIV